MDVLRTVPAHKLRLEDRVELLEQQGAQHMAAIDDLRREIQETKDEATALSAAVDGAVAKIDELKAVVAGLPQTAEIAALAAELDVLQGSMASARAKAEEASESTAAAPPVDEV